MTELLRLCNRSRIAKQRVIVVKYSRDNRYDDVMLCTHDLRKMDAISAIRISDVYNQLLDFDVIGIDEGQFVSHFNNE
jgi:thymidine kinase